MSEKGEKRDMKCHKCGAEVNAQDNFCEVCGVKISETIESVSIATEKLAEKENVKTEEKTSKKKPIGIIVGAVVTIVIALAAFFILKPKVYEFKCEELATLIAENPMETYDKYEGKTITIQGYIYREVFWDQAILSSNKIEDPNTVQDTEGLIIVPVSTLQADFDSLGNNSEIIATGTLFPGDAEKSFVYFSIEEIEVLTLEERTYTFDSVNELARNIVEDTEIVYEKLKDKVIQVEGYLFRDDDSNRYFLYENEDDDPTELDLDEGLPFYLGEELSSDFNEVGNGSLITISGVLEPVDEDITVLWLKTNNVNVIELKEMLYAVDSVENLLDEPEKYMGKKVSVTGALELVGSDSAVMCDVENQYNNRYISLIEISNTDLQQIDYGVYSVVGVYCIEGSSPAIQVESIEYVSELEPAKTAYTFDSVMALNAEIIYYVGETVTVYGQVITGVGSNPTANLMDPLYGDLIDLDLSSYEEGWYRSNEYAYVTGVLLMDDYGYYIQVENMSN